MPRRCGGVTLAISMPMPGAIAETALAAVNTVTPMISASGLWNGADAGAETSEKAVLGWRASARHPRTLAGFPPPQRCPGDPSQDHGITI
jgi:hypothetical protein